MSDMGLVFAGLADRVYRVRGTAGSLALGVVWSVVSFVVWKTQPSTAAPKPVAA